MVMIVSAEYEITPEIAGTITLGNVRVRHHFSEPCVESVLLSSVARLSTNKTVVAGVIKCRPEPCTVS